MSDLLDVLGQRAATHFASFLSTPLSPPLWGASARGVSESMCACVSWLH